MKLSPLAAALPLFLAPLAFAQDAATPATPAAPAQTSAATTSASDNDTPPEPLQGRIENGRYHAPGNVFSVAVPVLHGDKTAIMDNGEIVVFKDKVATLLTIASFSLPPFEKWQHDTTPPRDYLIQMFRENILRDYATEFPGSSIENARFIPGFQGGTLAAFTLMPGGSAFEPATPPPAGTPAPAAKRGHLVFVRDDRVFVFAIELAERVTQGAEYKLTTEEEDRMLFGRLITVVATTRFGPDEEPSGIEAAAGK